MRIFWKATDWAAIGLVIVAAIFLAQLAMGSHFPFADKCELSVIAYMCRGFPGADILAFVLTLPILLFIYAPVGIYALPALLFSAGHEPYLLNGPMFAITLASIAWLILGVIGAFRFVRRLVSRWI